MKNKIALESLAMDLKRTSIFFHRKSDALANRFLKEALERKSEIETDKTKKYIRKVIFELDAKLKNEDFEKKAEDLLMYSTIIQNYALSL